MELTKKAIETIAVNAVRDSVVQTDYLDQFIVDNDKEPSWDGFVYIYKDKSKKKNMLSGRMPVQVKGKLCENHSKSAVSYLVSKVDLQNYLNDGGCVFFVVYIGNGGNTKKIYYNALTPIKLKKLLYAMQNKDTKNKTIQLEEFPSDSNSKSTIFLNCFRHCQRQTSTIERKWVGIKNIKEQGSIENFVIPISAYGSKDLIRELLKNEIYIYANIKGHSILEPLDMIVEDLETIQTVDVLVKIEGKNFYNNFQIVRSKNQSTYKFGDSFTITFDESNGKCSFHYKNSNKFRTLVTDLEFFIALMNNKCIDIDNNLRSFDFQLNSDVDFNEKELKNYLEGARKVVTLLDILGCSDDIDINTMEETDWENLDCLLTAFVDKKPITGIKNNVETGIFDMNVGRLKFRILLEKCDESEGYKILDFFKIDAYVEIEHPNKNGGKLRISPYSLLTEKEILTIDNINFDILLPSFQKVEDSKEALNIANRFFLELLKACDKAEGIRKERILKVAQSFSEWMANLPDEKFDKNIKLLNKLQTIKRIREYSEDEIRRLYAIIEDGSVSDDIKAGVYLLLDQQVAAEMYLEKLSKEEQNYFKKYPIYHFWKGRKN